MTWNPPMWAARTVPLALLAVAAAGCQRTSPPPLPDGVEVGGRLLLPDGSPVTGGILVLRPVGGLHGASGPVRKDGRFALADQTGRAAVVPGKYQVYVLFNDPADKALRAAVNARYQSTEDGDSDVVAEVAAATSNLTVKLKR